MKRQENQKQDARLGLGWEFTFFAGGTLQNGGHEKGEISFTQC